MTKGLYYQDLQYTPGVERCRFLIRRLVHLLAALRVGSLISQLERLDTELLYKPAGINHQMANLKVLLCEAAYLDRVAVVSRPNLAPVHNLGRWVTSPWETHIDLAESVVTCHDSPIALAYETIGDFKANEVGRQAMMRLKHGERISAEQNRRYALIIRDFRFRTGRFWPAMIDFPDLAQMDVRFKPSRGIRDLAAAVAAAIGPFCAVHVRRGDQLKHHPGLAEATKPEQILEKISSVWPQEHAVYILTDEQRHDYFDLLRLHYRVYQYFDFSELRAAREADNYLLYTVEKEIFQRADVRIYTFKRSDSSHEHYLCAEERRT